MLICTAATSAASAQQAFVDRYEYAIDDDGVRITGVRSGANLSGTVIIPSSFTDPELNKTYPVYAIVNDWPEYGNCHGAFYGQSEITAIQIPSTITRIEEGVFTGCKKLREFRVSAANKHFKAIDGALYRISDDYWECVLLRFPPAKTSAGFTLPAEIKYIGAEAFADNYTVATLRIADRQELRHTALKGNLGISKFELTDCIMYSTDGHFLYERATEEGILYEKIIAAVAPKYCMEGTLAIPSDVDMIKSLSGSRATAIKIQPNIKGICAGAFEGTAFRSVTIPETVTSLRTGSLFSECPQLESVNIQACDNDRCLGSYMFADCPQLSSVKLSSKFNIMLHNCFANCTSLEKIEGLYRINKFQTEWYGGTNQFSNTGLKSFTVPSTWEEIPLGMFMDCKNLTSVTFPDHDIKVGISAFEGTGVKSINTRGVNEFSYRSFADCPNLTKVIIPEHKGVWGDGYFNMICFKKDAELYIDHKEMGGLQWPDTFYWSEGLTVYTSKRAFSYFFGSYTEIRGVYVPAGSRPHYRSLAGETGSWYDKVYEMFVIPEVSVWAGAVTVTPKFDWVKITGVTLNGKEATVTGDRWKVEKAGSDKLRAVISYTANGVPMSTEYTLTASTGGVDDVAADAENEAFSPRKIVYRAAQARRDVRYFDLTGRQCTPAEGSVCIVVPLE